MSQPPLLDESVSRVPARWTTWVAWLIILALIATLYLARAGSRPAAGPAERVSPAELQSVQLRLIARYAVGLNALMGDRVDARTHAKLREDVWSAARTPAEALRAVMVIGELHGADAALEKLQGLGQAVFRDDLWRDADTLTLIYREGPDAVAAPARAQLIERHGWFARLALSYGLPGENPARQAALRPAVRAFLAIVGLLLGALAAAIVGLVLLVVALSTLYRKPWRRYALGALDAPPPLPGGPIAPGAAAPRRANRAGGAFIEAFVIYLLGTVATALVLAALMDKVPLELTALSGVFVVLAILWPRWRGVSWRDLRLGLGWYRPRSLWREPLAGVVGYVTGLPIIAAGIGVTLLLGRFTQVSPTHPILRELAAGGVWNLVALYLLACVWAPLVEETLFRGALYHHQRGRSGWVLSAIVVGAVFAALHPQGWTAIPVLGAIGFVLAAIREWRGTIYASMTAHALNNFTAVTVIVLAMR